MKIIGISASPRRHGNSETLLDHALMGAHSNGAETEKIILSILDIKPCHGSDTCLKKGKCFVKDDMPALMKKIDKADGVIISSPVYFGSITAQLKAMIDRCQPFWVEKYILKKNRRRKKRGAFICVSSYNDSKFFRNSKEIIYVFFKVLDVDLLCRSHFTGLENRNDAKNNPAFIEKAFLCGKKIAKS